MYNRLYWFFAHLSMAGNALFGGRPYETLCARAWGIYITTPVKRTEKLAHAWSWVMVHSTNLVDRNHCRKAYVAYNYIRRRLP